MGCIATSGFLIYRHVLPDSVDDFFIFCKQSREDVDHVLVHCSFTWRIWSTIFLWWGVSWLAPQSFQSFFLYWFNTPGSKSTKIVWSAILFSMIWNIWISRNAAIFYNGQPNWSSVVEASLVNVAQWVRVFFGSSDFSVNDFLFNIDGVKGLKLARNGAV